MPFQITLDLLLSGYAAESVRAGEMGKVFVKEFVSSEDGDEFIKRLEGIPSTLISRLPKDAGIKEAMVSHMLAIIRRDNTATVYVNELSEVMLTRLSRGCKKGEPIFEKDIVDITEYKFAGVSIPNDAGVAIIFSKGWRKGFFYDLTPLHEPYEDREYDIWKTLGHCFNYLFHQNYFKITEDEWQQMFAQQWFPFITIPPSIVTEMLNCLRSCWSIDELLDKVSDELLKIVQNVKERWKSKNIFSEHIDLLDHAIERYEAGDYISATAILYPRIEGLMRSIHHQFSPEDSVNQKSLSGSMIKCGGAPTDRYSKLLPLKFKEYIKDVYFANFTPGEDAPVSRNSVSHGVAKSVDYSKKAATIGLLIVDQIVYHLPPEISGQT